MGLRTPKEDVHHWASIIREETKDGYSFTDTTCETYKYAWYIAKHNAFLEIQRRGMKGVVITCKHKDEVCHWTFRGTTGEGEL